jgi:hypothetical protein
VSFLKVKSLHKDRQPAKRKNRLALLGETLRTASGIQRSIRRGRTTYIDMFNVNRIVEFNLRSHVQSVRNKLGRSVYEEILHLLSQLSSGYENTISPSGNIKKKELEHLISLDSEIAIQLGTLKNITISAENYFEFEEYKRDLKQLIGERKKFVRSIRA